MTTLSGLIIKWREFTSRIKLLLKNCKRSSRLGVTNASFALQNMKFIHAPDEESIKPKIGVNADDIKYLRDWLSQQTVEPILNRTVSVEVDFQETTGVKLHFRCQGMCSLCIQLNADGTWSFTVGQ